MACVANEAKCQTRRQYSREKKLEIVGYYYETAKQNKYQTCQKFSINKNNLLRWILNEDSIQKAKKGAKRTVVELRVTIGHGMELSGCIFVWVLIHE